MHIFHGISHSPNVETPERFAGLLGRFVAEVGEFLLAKGGDGAAVDAQSLASDS